MRLSYMDYVSRLRVASCTACKFYTAVVTQVIAVWVITLCSIFYSSFSVFHTVV